MGRLSRLWSEWRSDMPGKTFKGKKTLLGHKKAVSCLKFSPSGSELASGSGDCTVKIWEPKSGKLLRTLDGQHKLGVNDIAWDRTSRYLCSACDDKTIIIWDTKEAKVIRVLAGHTKCVFCVNFNQESNLIAS